MFSRGKKKCFIKAFLPAVGSGCRRCCGQVLCGHIPFMDGEQPWGSPCPEPLGKLWRFTCLEENSGNPSVQPNCKWLQWNGSSPRGEKK